MDMSKKKAGKLGKVKMPEKRKGEEELALVGDEELAELGEEEMEEGEGMDDLGLEMAEEGAEDMELGGELSSMSDDELLAEVKKRGLMAQLGSGEEESSEEDEYSLKA